MNCISPVENHRRDLRGVTLVELLIVVALVASLIVLCIQGYKSYRSYVQNKVCVERIKNLGAAFGSCLIAKETWPQMPQDIEQADEEEYFKWWIKEMEPFGPAAEDWWCATDLSLWKQDLAKGGPKVPDYWGSYYPTPFASGPTIPFLWKQPWLIERTDYHGMGQNLLMPDGSVQRFKSPMSKPIRKK